MVEFVLAVNPHKVIDLGCGEGHFLEHLFRNAPGIEGIGVELEPSAAERCRKRLAGFPVQVMTADLLDFLPGYSGEPVGTVVCGDVIYFLPRETVSQQVVPAIAKLLRPGGTLVISCADVNDYAWNVDVFQNHFQVEKQVYIKPVQNPPSWSWMVALLRVKDCRE